MLVRQRCGMSRLPSFVAGKLVCQLKASESSVAELCEHPLCVRTDQQRPEAERRSGGNYRTYFLAAFLVRVTRAGVS